jgi:hypothetical protein
LQPGPGARQPLDGGTQLIALLNRDWPGTDLGDLRPVQRDHAQPSTGSHTRISAAIKNR